MRPTILLTGCVGFVGCHAAIELLKSGFKVIGIDNLSNPSIDATDRIKAAVGEAWQNFRFYKLDCKDHETLLSVFAQEDIHSIVHLAAKGSISRSFGDPLSTMQDNVIGFTSMMSLVPKLRISRFIFASSSNVYGNNSDEIKVEGKEGLPMNPYGLSKLQNEDLARIWCGKIGVSYIGLRFFNVYGPGQSPFSEYAAVIPRFFCDDQPKIYGDGENTRDFTYVKDVAKVIKMSIETPYKNFVVNVGAGQSTSINDLAKMIVKDRDIVKKAPRPGEIKHSRASVKNLQRIYNWSPTTTLIEGLRETEEFYKWQSEKRQVAEDSSQV